MSTTHTLMQARDHRWGSGRVHIVNNHPGYEAEPGNPLGLPMLMCGIRGTAPTHRGKLSEVTCKRCLSSLERQIEDVERSRRILDKENQS